MHRKCRDYCCLTVLLLAMAGAAAAAPKPVTTERIIAADREPQNWLAHGRTYGEQRYSPLQQVNAGNVEKLGLAWSYATGTTRGLQATPIVVDGRMYATGVWSVVYALDAKTGKELWKFDPEVPRAWGRYTGLHRAAREAGSRRLAATGAMPEGVTGSPDSSRVRSDR